jgi:ring-1,2-phenylacetyl-CoA epoxidase subunit PaaE
VPPEGTLYPEHLDRQARHLILFAAGSGITPVFSIAQHALKARPDHHVTLFYANSSTRDIMFAKELEALANSARMEVFHILGDGGTGEDDSSGRLTGPRVAKLMDQYGGGDLPEHAFLCGPQGFMDSVEVGLQTAQRPITYSRYSFIHQPHLHPADPGVDTLTSTVTVQTKTGTKVLEEVPRHLTLLEVADQAGVDMPADCRSGICHRCKARLVAGRTVAKPDRTGSKPLADGWILCCQERPASGHLDIELP